MAFATIFMLKEPEIKMKLNNFGGDSEKDCERDAMHVISLNDSTENQRSAEATPNRGINTS